MFISKLALSLPLYSHSAGILTQSTDNNLSVTNKRKVTWNLSKNWKLWAVR